MNEIIIVGDPKRDLPKDLLYSAYSNTTLAEQLVRMLFKPDTKITMDSEEYGLLTEAAERLKSYG